MVSEELISNTGNCGVCNFIKGEVKPFVGDQYDKIVPNFTTVQIGNITAEYAAGDWENYNRDKGSWTWNPDPYLKRLRWQVNGMAFELSYFGIELTQADLMTIAESIQ
jgi:hypothetical protein